MAVGIGEVDTISRGPTGPAESQGRNAARPDTGSRLKRSSKSQASRSRLCLDRSRARIPRQAQRNLSRFLRASGWCAESLFAGLYGLCIGRLSEFSRASAAAPCETSRRREGESGALSIAASTDDTLIIARANRDRTSQANFQRFNMLDLILG